MKSDLKKRDSFTLETSKNHLIRNFLRNGRERVNAKSFILGCMVFDLRVIKIKQSNFIFF